MGSRNLHFKKLHSDFGAGSLTTLLDRILENKTTSDNLLGEALFPKIVGSSRTRYLPCHLQTTVPE